MSSGAGSSRRGVESVPGQANAVRAPAMPPGVRRDSNAPDPRVPLSHKPPPNDLGPLTALVMGIKKRRCCQWQKRGQGSGYAEDHRREPARESREAPLILRKTPVLQPLGTTST